MLFDYFRFSRFAFDWIFLEDSPGVRATVLSPCAPACIKREKKKRKEKKEKKEQKRREKRGEEKRREEKRSEKKRRE